MQPLARPPTAPRRARSAYFLWCDAARADETPDAEMDGKSMAVASKVLSARWKALTAEQREPYERRAAELKAEIRTAKRRPAAGGGSRAPLPLGWRAVRDAMTGRVGYACAVGGRCQWHRPTEADAVAAPPPLPTARRLFEEALRERGETPSAARWAALPAEEREAYAARAAEVRKKRCKDLKHKNFVMAVF